MARYKVQNMCAVLMIVRGAQSSVIERGWRLKAAGNLRVLVMGQDDIYMPTIGTDHDSMRMPVSVGEEKGRYECRRDKLAEGEGQKGEPPRQGLSTNKLWLLPSHAALDWHTNQTGQVLMPILSRRE